MVYCNRDRIGKNAIIDIHGISSDSKDKEDRKEVNYDKIVSLVEKYNKNKNLHFVVNQSINRAEKIYIRVENL
jgi:hypothetical protein